jgi:hypothetical protein
MTCAAQAPAFQPPHSIDEINLATSSEETEEKHQPTFRHTPKNPQQPRAKLHSAIDTGSRNFFTFALLVEVGGSVLG